MSFSTRLKTIESKIAREAAFKTQKTSKKTQNTSYMYSKYFTTKIFL